MFPTKFFRSKRRTAQKLNFEANRGGKLVEATTYLLETLRKEQRDKVPAETNMEIFICA